MTEIDRRRDPRFVPDRALVVQVRAIRRGSVVHLGTVTDLSARGLRLTFASPHGLGPGDEVRVFFAPSHGTQSAGIQGECVEAEVVGGAHGDALTIHVRADELTNLSEPDFAAYLNLLGRMAS